MSFKITENDCGRRVDRVLRKLLSDIPLSRIYAALRKGNIRVNGKKTVNNYILQLNDMLAVNAVLLSQNQKFFTRENYPVQKTNGESDAEEQLSTKKILQPEKCSSTILTDKNILYRDDDFLILKKQRFELVHGSGSLDEAVKAEYEYALQHHRRAQSLSFQPGPLHRLDFGTSGIVVFSQSLKGAHIFSEQLRNGKVLRFYFALLVGHCPKKAFFHSPISGKSAATKLQLLQYFPEKNLSLVEIQILTGRKHQIRIHCAKNGFPLFGDAQFGTIRKRKTHSAYFLHFYKMECSEKILQLPKSITCPLPEYFSSVLGTEALF